MLKQKILLLLRIYKEKIYIWVIIFLLILLAAKNGSNYFLETITETVPRPINTVESTDLFNQSIPWVLEEWVDWVSNVTYKTKEWTTTKEKYKVEVVTEKKEQKEKQWTLDYSQYQVQIGNNVSTYLQAVKNQDYKSAIWYYYDLTTHNSPEITKYNYENLIKINWNPIITSTEPLYNYSSSKAIAVTNVDGDFEDLVTWKKFTTLSIYSIWNWKEFKIFNPEYLSLPVKWWFLDKLVQWTNTSKSHYLGLEVSKFFIRFPNKIYFSLNAKTTENVLFNKVKVEVTNNKTWEKYYQWTVTYNDISEKAEWIRTVYKWKAWYKTMFYVPIEFKKEVFSTIYDKMYKDWQFAINDIQISIKPINDSDVYMNYSVYKFNLSWQPIEEKIDTKSTEEIK